MRRCKSNNEPSIYVQHYAQSPTKYLVQWFGVSIDYGRVSRPWEHSHLLHPLTALWTSWSCLDERCWVYLLAMVIVQNMYTTCYLQVLYIYGATWLQSLQSTRTYLIWLVHLLMYVLTPASNLVDLALSQATGIDVLVLVTAQSCFHVAHELQHHISWLWWRLLNSNMLELDFCCGWT